MMKAAQSDVAEIQGGQVAKEKAASDAVKKFADQMVTDHTKTSDQMKAMAQSGAWRFRPPRQRKIRKT